jgi:hypothetical protein
MKIGKRNLGVALGVLLGAGAVGQASADVYGLAYLNIDNLSVNFGATGSATTFNFATNQDAALNSNPDLSSGAADCAGSFPSPGNCTVGDPVLSGTVQNAPGGTLNRGEGDYTIFGQTGDYANAEAEIVRATLVLANPPQPGYDGTTQVTAISESNLQASTSGQANTVAQSGTTLLLTFTVGSAGTLSVSFTADINVQAEVFVPDGGLATAATSASLTLQKEGTTQVTWAPIGESGDLGPRLCNEAGGLTCVATEEDGLDLNVTRVSAGALASMTGSGSYQLDITGLTSGTYTLAFTTSSAVNVTREVPVPGTLLLMGTGLLLGARAMKRKTA